MTNTLPPPPTIALVPSCVDVLFATSPVYGTCSILTGAMRPFGTDGTAWLPHLHSIYLHLPSCWDFIPCARIFHTSPGAPPPTLRFNNASIPGKPWLARPTQEIGFQITGFESVSEILLNGTKEEIILTWDKDGEGRFSTGLGPFQRAIPADVTVANSKDDVVEIGVSHASKTSFTSFVFDYENEIGLNPLQIQTK